MRKGLPNRKYNCADGLRTKTKQKNANTALPAFRLALKGNDHSVRENKNERYRNENVSLDEIIKSNFMIGEKAMNNFIFENSSKVYFGEGCVKC